MKLRRYWFSFDIPPGHSVPHGILIGCGLTSYSYEDALSILKERVFKDSQMPKIKNFIEDVDVSVLDKNHVAPNMGIVTQRGVWFPLGY